MGYNYEVVSFSPFKSYEFVDAGGSDVQRHMLQTFLNAVTFDYIVYVIDMTGYLKADVEKRAGYFREDRENLRRLLSHLRNQDEGETRLIVYINYREDVETELKGNKGKQEQRKKMLKAFLMGELGLERESDDPEYENPTQLWIPPENFVDRIYDEQGDFADLKSGNLLSLLDVDTSVDKWEPNCYSEWGTY
eukprot:CAMPEP_0184493788 /NCGR_PEP_ID=MMETSP0113_2-20130426/26941_1 /TAXON_ID=91329 /ORGANISM="Norrisiella sphaerica, Strain BC52" /LENGTH=191 /DNA_ID=CAMNT_0026879207 /DNA_START=348 /DNA_END=920 /DNA_ORIENTATION=-